MWTKKPRLDELQELAKHSLCAFLGIEYCSVDEGSLSAKMAITQRTQQPFGDLHGGASAALAESVSSMAAYFCVDQERYRPVGLHLEIHHLQGAQTGVVFATASPIRLGKSIQVWQVDITQENIKIAFSTVTIKVLKKGRRGSPAVKVPNREQKRL
ncbi:MAG: PaaI family thioesterase [Chlamydiota bacterium]